METFKNTSHLYYLTNRYLKRETDWIKKVKLFLGSWQIEPMDISIGISRTNPQEDLKCFIHFDFKYIFLITDSKKLLQRLRKNIYFPNGEL